VYALNPSTGAITRQVTPDNLYNQYSINGITEDNGTIYIARASSQGGGQLLKWNPDNTVEVLENYPAQALSVAVSGGVVAVSLRNGMVDFPTLDKLLVLNAANVPIFRVEARKNFCGFFAYSSDVHFGYGHLIACDGTQVTQHYMAHDWSVAIGTSIDATYAVAPLDYIWYTNRAEYNVVLGRYGAVIGRIAPFENYLTGLDFNSDGQLIACLQAGTDYPINKSPTVTVWTQYGQKLASLSEPDGGTSNIKWVGTNLFYAIDRYPRLATTNTVPVVTTPTPTNSPVKPPKGKGRR
jgi:hypothetical protein